MIEYDPLTRRVPAPCLVTSEISQSCRSRSVANHQVIAMRYVSAFARCLIRYWHREVTPGVATPPQQMRVRDCFDRPDGALARVAKR
jgi:hypothetical protein